MSFGSSPSIENRFRNNTPYSSTVCAARVVTRQFATSLSYRGGGAESVKDFAKTPSTVFVLPTSRTSSITGIYSTAGSRALSKQLCPVLISTLPFRYTQSALPRAYPLAEGRADQAGR